MVEEHVVQTRPEQRNTKTHIVKAAWFWFTIQNGYAYELEYLYKDVCKNVNLCSIFVNLTIFILVLGEHG